MCQVHTGAYVRLTTRAWKNRLHRLPPTKATTYLVYIIRITYLYAYERQTQVNWEKQRKEETKKARKDNVEVRQCPTGMDA